VIVLDASVLIAHLDETDGLHRRAEEALSRAAREPFGCSPITLAEVLVGPARQGRLEVVRAVVRALAVAEIPFGDEAATRLAKLGAATRLKMPDCCVLLAAQDRGAPVILTFDDALARAAKGLGLTSA
jgi:predicted nucleic acid-binding protein